MCGIAGIVGGTPQARSRIDAMLESLRHRGPDGEGRFDDGHAVLGHRRLSIIDLAGGRQPLRNVEGTVWLVCNGEIYNYRELRRELESRGHRFLTQSDCEVIIGLYEVYGDRLLEHLRGMFAFALWDARKQRLLAARDHLGQKPFFYSYQADTFAFGSEIKALLAFEPRLRELNLRALDQYLALRLIAPPLTMFRDIAKLPPGHMLVLERGSAPKVSAYWELRFRPKLTRSEPQLLEELEGHIEEALRLHMVSDVPVGAFLSGGLDSSLLVAMMAKRLGIKDLPTFTLGLDYQRFDEAPFARAVAQDCHSQHHEQSVVPSLLPVLPELIRHLDEPSDPLSLCAYQVAALASRHVKVVIGGDGGDELFGGYDRYYGYLYAARYSRIPAAVRRRVIGPCLNLVPAAGWYKSIGHQMRWLQRLSFLSGGERYAASLSYFYFDALQRGELFSREALTALSGFDATAAIKEPFEALAGADPVDRMLYADSTVRLPDHPVMITDRMSMAHGLETRSPFMDHRLAEFAASLPWTMKIRGRKLRVIQRQLAARYLPADILQRPKQGFSSALPYILRNEYRLLSDHYLRDSALVRAGILDGGAIDRLLAQHLNGRSDHGNRLWLLINSEIWYRMLILQQPTEELKAAPNTRLASAA
ncbi:MAG TPA: asparagine synthase (glutamine-hydrolyzing) [Steroidobacteraceae bacterium]|nr:asparagine synthase (glutamine-hydrolyzing) [Steroidobacteraceae bacterium]